MDLKNKDIIKIDNSEVLCSFNVNEKTYCALVDNDSPDEELYFALRTSIDDDNYVLTSVPEPEIDAVIKEYEKLVNIFEAPDELDEEEGYNE